MPRFDDFPVLVGLDQIHRSAFRQVFRSVGGFPRAGDDRRSGFFDYLIGNVAHRTVEPSLKLEIQSVYQQRTNRKVAFRLAVSGDAAKRQLDVVRRFFGHGIDVDYSDASGGLEIGEYLFQHLVHIERVLGVEGPVGIRM